MERLFTDASFSHTSGIGGMAVVAPEWSAIYGDGPWRSRWDIRLAREPEYGAVVFCASCQCRGSVDAEKRALGLAFLLAYDMIAIHEDAGYRGVQVEVITDSLSNLDLITWGDTRGDPILQNLCGMWDSRRIVLTKVRGHAGNWGNELADKWSKHIRRDRERTIGQQTFRRY